jgi:hypothetical protein
MVHHTHGIAPGIYTPNEKAAGVSQDSKRLKTDTSNATRIIAPCAHDSQLALMSKASEINAAHQHAIKHADKAIAFARQAGELLMQVKSALPHGAFLPWVEKNCTVSPRQAQRYMSAAQGKPMPIRSIKSDTVSHFAEKSDVGIPLGSVGDVEWRDSQGNHLHFEAHPMLFPDGKTIGLRCVYMLAGPGEHSGAYVEYDRRGINAEHMNLRKRAAKYGVPLERMTISVGEAPLWESMHQMDLHDARKVVV